MRVLGWLLIGAGVAASLLALVLARPPEYLAGYALGTPWLLSAVGIVCALVQSRKGVSEKGRRIVAVIGAVVLVLNLWGAWQLVQIARVDRAMTAARPEVDRILQAAVTEGTLLNSGQLDPRTVSGAWQPYDRDPGIDLHDSHVPLEKRLIELARRAKGRELALTRELWANVRKSHLRTILQPAELIGEQSRAEAKEFMPRYRTFLDDYAERVRAMSRAVEADEQALGLPRASADAMISGLTRGSNETVQAVMKFVDRERKALTTATTLVNYVDARADDAQLIDGHIKFTNVSLQVEYDRLRAQLDAQPAVQVNP